MAIKPAAAAAHYKAEADGNGAVLLCNGQPHLTPAGNAYRLPTLALAAAMADEWRGQGAKINPATMPLTQLAATALDITAAQRARIVEQLAAYGAAELLCHRAETPPVLAIRQQELWQPLLDWCALTFDALLRVGTGIMPIAQSAAALQALRRAVAAYDDFALTGLHQAADQTGSLVLGLALAERYQDAATIFEAAVLDELHQAIKWGDDPVTAARHSAIRNELEHLERWFALLK